MIIAAAFVILQLLCAGSDIRFFRIPNALPLALVGTFGCAAAVNPGAVDWESHLGAFVIVVVAASVLFYLGMMGGGDVKLLAATALWVGLPLLLPFVLLTTLFGGVLALFKLLLHAIRAAGKRLRRVGACESPHVPVTHGLPYGVAIAGAALAMLHALPQDLFLF